MLNLWLLLILKLLKNTMTFLRNSLYKLGTDTTPLKFLYRYPVPYRKIHELLYQYPVPYRVLVVPSCTGCYRIKPLGGKFIISSIVNLGGHFFECKNFHFVMVVLKSSKTTASLFFLLLIANDLVRFSFRIAPMESKIPWRSSVLIFGGKPYIIKSFWMAICFKLLISAFMKVQLCVDSKKERRLWISTVFSLKLLQRTLTSSIFA